VIVERVDRSDTDAVSGIHHKSSVASALIGTRTLHRRTPAFLCPLKRAVPCRF
jgi:hypothetical protein